MPAEAIVTLPSAKWQALQLEVLHEQEQARVDCAQKGSLYAFGLTTAISPNSGHTTSQTILFLREFTIATLVANIPFYRKVDLD